jgi:hypothetical protein
MNTLAVAYIRGSQRLVLRRLLLINPKTEADLTADYADYTDTIGYDYQCPEGLPRKDS